MDLKNQNFFLSSFSSFISIAIFLMLLVHVPICSSNVVDDINLKYSNCSRYFECGFLKNISYPFWGNGRPDYCGIPGYKLDCQNGSLPEIQISFKKYRILSIDKLNNTMRITKKDFIDDFFCPMEVDNTTLDFKLFNYAPGVRNLTLYHNKNQSSSTSCRNSSIVIPIMDTALARLRSNPSTLSDVVKEGFNVRYVAAENTILLCNECEKSGGACGHNNNSNTSISSNLQTITCFCPIGTGPDQSRCYVESGHGSLKKKIIIGATAAVGGVITIVFLFMLIRYSRNKSSSNNGSLATLSKKKETDKNDNQKVEAFIKSYGSLAPRRFRYIDIKKMTNSFKEKLGQGGYGAVFKGQLRDGRLVAVKVLFSKSEKTHNGEEFINEVANLTRTCHVNIVALLGFCFEKNKKALVYEFMANGSLDKFIYGGGENQLAVETEHTLGWETLYQIAVGIARGLEYLHRGCTTRILHFDIKPHNILLDEEFCPKISDFGLAKLCPGKESTISMLGTRGTAGYIAPEVFSRNFGGVSHKSDVYSYGMMVLEMVGGRKNIDVKVGIDHSSQLYFPHWIYDRLEKEEGLGLHGMMTEEREEATRKMIIVGLWCIQTNSSSRPSMSKVLEMLEGSVEALQIPPKPFLTSPPRSPLLPNSSSAISMS